MHSTSRQTTKMLISAAKTRDLDHLTQRHMSVFLYYLNVNEWVDTEEVRMLMRNELNNISVDQSTTAWVSDMNKWIESVKNKLADQIRTKCPTAFSTEEKTLLQHLKDEQIYVSPTPAELSCILDHLEIAGDSPKLWTTLSLELEDEHSRKSETYWEKNFSRISAGLLIKLEILQKLAEQQIPLISPELKLTPLQQRLALIVKPLKNVTSVIDSTLNCRVCLHFGNQMVYIFDDIHDEMPLIEKMTHCANVTLIDKDDGFPQYICCECLDLLESAYKFKTLCEKTEQALRIIKRQIKQEVVKNYCSSMQEEDEVASYEKEAIQNDVSDDEPLSQDKRISMDTIPPMTDFLVDSNEMPTDDSTPSAQMLQRIPYYLRVPSQSCTEPNDDAENDKCAAEDIVKEPTIDGSVVHTKASSPGKKISRKHSPDPIHKCDTCGRICSSSSTLRMHFNTHSATKNFKCKDCGKSFKTRLSLTIHMRSHTGERPYICETCGKAFKTVSAVNNHRAIHSSVKEFQCAQCPYRACTKANLNIHERSHSGVQPYACRLCTLRFSTASNMHKHIRNIHEKLKTHKCDQCDRSFFTRESARKHMVTHTRLRPYTCSMCNMSYGWYNGLQKHMKMIHPGLKMPTEKSFFKSEN